MSIFTKKKKKNSIGDTLLCYFLSYSFKLLFQNWRANAHTPFEKPEFIIKMFFLFFILLEVILCNDLINARNICV